MLTVDFAGERFDLVDEPFVIGREGDLRIEDNLYLHRRFLELRPVQGFWWLSNIGNQITATVSDQASGVHAWLAPNGRMPIVFGVTRVQFGAGQTNYEIELILNDAPYEFDPLDSEDDGTTTIGFSKVPLTHDQRRMLVALAEGTLLRGTSGTAELPSASEAAKRLGWTPKKFEKKIDNVCDRLAAKGVRGLKGDQGNHALSRRARLVQYALATRLITADDLPILDAAASTFVDAASDGDEFEKSAD